MAEQSFWDSKTLADLTNLAGVAGGLGLGLARPRIGDQARQTAGLVSLMQQRQDANEERDLARRETQRQHFQNLAAQLAQHGIATTPDELATPDNMSTQLTKMAQQVQTAEKNALAFPNAPLPVPPSATALPPPGVETPMPLVPPHTVSALPPLALEGGTPATPPPSTPAAPLTPPAVRPPAAASTGSSFFPFPAQPTQMNVTGSVTAPISKITRGASTNYGTVHEQQTNSAVRDLTQAYADPFLGASIHQFPVEAMQDLLVRYPQADPNKVKEGVTQLVVGQTRRELLNTPEGHAMHPAEALRMAHERAQTLLGPFYRADPQTQTATLHVPSIEERRSLAANQRDPQALRYLNEVESNRAAALQGAQNTADIYTKALGASDISNIPGAQMGQTMDQVRGTPALDTQGVQQFRAIKQVLPMFTTMEKINNVIANSKEWKDLPGQKLDVLQAKYLSAGKPEVVAAINTYEANRQLIAVAYARTKGFVGNPTAAEQFLGASVIPASGEFGPTAQKKWDFIFRDLQSSLDSFKANRIEQIQERVPKRTDPSAGLVPPPSVPHILTPQQQEFNRRLNLERPSAPNGR